MTQSCVSAIVSVKEIPTFTSRSLSSQRWRRSGALSSLWQKKWRKWRGSTAPSWPRLILMRVSLSNTSQCSQKQSRISAPQCFLRFLINNPAPFPNQLENYLFCFEGYSASKLHHFCLCCQWGIHWSVLGVLVHIWSSFPAKISRFFPLNALIYGDLAYWICPGQQLLCHTRTLMTALIYNLLE